MKHISDLLAIKPLPKVDFDYNQSYVAWNLKLKDCVLAQRAVKYEKTLHFDIDLE
jgi:hypothetical protein